VVSLSHTRHSLMAHWVSGMHRRHRSDIELWHQLAFYQSRQKKE
jgi:hypothetical protein